MRDVQCKRCIEYKGNWCDKKRDDPDPDMVRDCHWFRTKTNADRIRAMTDEELAKMFDGWIQDCGCNAVPCHKNCHITDGKSCMMRWLDWLKQEVSDNG